MDCRFLGIRFSQDVSHSKFTEGKSIIKCRPSSNLEIIHKILTELRPFLTKFLAKFWFPINNV